MIQCGMGSVQCFDTPFGMKRFVLWTEGWEKVVDVECSANGEANAPINAMLILLQECLDREILDNVEFVGDYPKLWTRLRKMQKEPQKSTDYCSQMLHDLLGQFKRVRFSAV